MQDTETGRDIKDNVKEDDFEYFRDIVYKGQCWFCEVRFTNKNPPTLDRIDSSLGHSKNNVQLACSWCNVKRGNRDPFITKGLIQLKRYYLAKGNSEGEQFSKITMNSSYGSDGMNQEHFSDIKLCDIHETFRKHLNGRFKSDRKLGGNLYAIEFEQQKFNCKTCLQVAFAVLDCAKYWFMNFYCNFLTPMVDMNRVHLIYCDTDSIMLAVAGDPKQNYKQGFSAVIKDKQFYDLNFYKFLPKPKSIIMQENKCSKGKIKELQIQDKKKPLGVAQEHCGSTLIALAPKNYWLRQEFDKKDPIVVKLKGM
ncbi:MAG: hypothetical protein EZS28_041626, partial [Streblomastix strix]